MESIAGSLRRKNAKALRLGLEASELLTGEREFTAAKAARHAKE